MPSASTIGKVDLVLLILVALFVYLHAFRPPFTPFFYESDQLIFLYDAERMLRGELIYRDFFQFTLPGTQLLYLALFEIFGPNYFVVGLVIMGIGLAFFWTTLALSREIIAGPLAYMPPCIFVFFSMRWFGMDGTHRMLSPIFILLAIWVLMRGASYYHAGVAGVLCGVASFFTQPRGVYTLLGCCLFLGINALFRKERLDKFVLKVTAATVGFSLTLIALCGYFIYSSGFENFMYSTLIYPLHHYSLHPENGSGEYFVELSKAFQLSRPHHVFKALAAFLHAAVLPIVPLITTLKFIRSYTPSSWEFWNKPMLLAVMATVSYLGISGPVHIRFFTISVPALILSIWLLSNIAVVRRFQQRITEVFVLGVIILGFFMVASWQIRTEVTIGEMPVGSLAVVPPNSSFGLYLWLRDRTTPGDAIYEVSEPFMYFPLGLRNPTKFGQVVPYGYTPSKHVELVLADLRKSPPQYIVWDNSYNIDDDVRRPDDSTGPLAAFVIENYVPVGPVYNIDLKPFQVWTRRPADREVRSENGVR